MKLSCKYKLLTFYLSLEQKEYFVNVSTKKIIETVYVYHNGIGLSRIYELSSTRHTPKSIPHVVLRVQYAPNYKVLEGKLPHDP